MTAYRARTGCTLFTLETHIHYLREVKASDAISVRARTLGVDAKRLHLGLALHCARLAEPAALGEFMLLHVQQQPTPKSATFPPDVLQRLARLAGRGPAAPGIGAGLAPDGTAAPLSARQPQALHEPARSATPARPADRRTGRIGRMDRRRCRGSTSASAFRGELWRVHPTRPSRPGAPYFRSIDELPAGAGCRVHRCPEPRSAGDRGRTRAARRRRLRLLQRRFLGDRDAEPECGSAQELEQAAGDVAIPRPQLLRHGQFLRPGRAVARPGRRRLAERGVALICQSGTIALTLMFNDRSLPIGYLLTVGNQTRLAAEDLIDVLCDDPRVTAFGLYLEGIKDTAKFARAVDKARARRQADRRGQVRPHRGRQPHRAQPHRRPGRQPTPCSTPTARRRASPAARRWRRSAKH